MCPGGKCPGGKCPGGICSWGKCSGGTCPGVSVLSPLGSIPRRLVKSNVPQLSKIATVANAAIQYLDLSEANSSVEIK